MRRLIWAVGILAGCSATSELDVAIDTGVVHGAEADGVRSWLGVPYAAPPVGELRWKPPQPAPHWGGTRDALAVGQKCPQNTVITPGGGDEDCLYLNVWAPSPLPAQPAPVMVWIHGGAFIFGSGGDPFYAGRELARTRGVIVVTLNYRLGGLGFLSHPALDAEDPAHPTSGNYGLLDQRAALQWVQRNIAAFGGDPGRVTLFGESAGGYSTCFHYLAPASAGLFRAAISESGVCSSSALEPARADAQAAGLALGAKLGCPGNDAAAIACLRGKDGFDVIDAAALPPIAQQQPGGAFFQPDIPFSTLPNIDGDVLVAPMHELFAAGNYPLRPLILGTNTDEGTLFNSPLLSIEVPDDAGYRAALARRFSASEVDAIVAQYPVSAYASPNAALSAVTSDFFFNCPARRTARATAQAGVPVYLYRFEHLLEQPLIANLGVFHSGEIPFVFGVDDYPLGKIGSGQSVVDIVQGYWTRFAATADPNGEGAVAWPRYDASAPHLVLDATVTTGSALAAATCDFWDALP